MTAPIVPVWQRPATWSRSLPRDWQRPEVLTGAVRKRPSRIGRFFKFAAGVLLALVFFYEINLIFTPGFWSAVLG